RRPPAGGRPVRRGALVRRTVSLALRIGFAIGVLGIATLGILPKYWPLVLPKLAQHSRIYAMPHSIKKGEDFVSSGLLKRLQRLGYRERQVGVTLAPGEYSHEKDKLLLHRRAFHGPGAVEEDRLAVVQVGSDGRIQSVRDARSGQALALLLEPEVIGEIH